MKKQKALLIFTIFTLLTFFVSCAGKLEKTTDGNEIININLSGSILSWTKMTKASDYEVYVGSKNSNVKKLVDNSKLDLKGLALEEGVNTVWIVARYLVNEFGISVPFEFASHQITITKQGGSYKLG